MKLTLSNIDSKDDAIVLAVLIRDSLLAELERHGLVQIPETPHDDNREAEEWWMQASEISERLAYMLRRAGVPDQRTDACKAVLAELA
jgi:hypothetical protein